MDFFSLLKYGTLSVQNQLPRKLHQFIYFFHGNSGQFKALLLNACQFVSNPNKLEQCKHSNEEYLRRQLSAIVTD